VHLKGIADLYPLKAGDLYLAGHHVTRAGDLDPPAWAYATTQHTTARQKEGEK
jgi:hypothetical protein